MELGLSTFGEIATQADGRQRVQELIEEAKLADALGLDVFALGEHHRPDYVISAPEMVLAAMAAVTTRLRLSSAVTVLSSADPVRVFQDFATLDLVSGGRAEIMAGRGSFIESFPLFGYDLDDYDALFAEKLELLLLLRSKEVVSWKGKFRAPIPNLGVYPRPVQSLLPVWVAVGGTPQSVIRAGALGLPLTIAILGGMPRQFVQLVTLYREAAREAGHDPAALPFAVNAHMYIADSSGQAADEFWPTYSALMNRIGKERGWQPLSRHHYDQLRSPQGPLLVGSAEEVTQKIIYMHGLFGNTRYLAQMISGGITHAQQMHSIGLFGEKVAPVVRELGLPLKT
ncbi:MAG TPA: LLM class flavin-dependent oxidoreductase [Dinghuibacter sp.]|jgi:probable LLM family oxidoreductase|uniref:LLM class flavin-dependent oxidoreductase n=1 Tax=Dinghuibacter sp. TaxID=2024697 RepID=UPI002B64C8B8|nr:LLM class flavin-dependent oxidoreductase [Dinghuibacter sp.]HTJ14089.1 LLM class flavin-dependent oxidoreductase [Dinghuibacter sp.]